MADSYETPARWTLALAVSLAVHGAGLVWLLQRPEQDAVPPRPAPIAIRAVADPASASASAAVTGPVPLQPVTLRPVGASAPLRDALRDGDTPAPTRPDLRAPETSPVPVTADGSAGNPPAVAGDGASDGAGGGADDSALLQSAAGRALPPITPAPAPAPRPAAPDRPAGPAGDTQTTPKAQAGGLAPQRPAPPMTAPAPRLRPSPRQVARLDPLRHLIRSQLDESCLLALPQLDPRDDIGLEVLGAQDLQMGQLARALNRDLPNPVTQRQILLDARQCAVLDYLRVMPGYPDMAMELRLDQPVLSSGETLRGQVLDLNGRQLTLLLIDDNGMVHDLRAFVAYGPGWAGFAVPLARIDQPRDTAQLLVALAADSPLVPQLAQSGQPASRFFAQLAQHAPPGLGAGLISFSLR